MVYYLPEKDEYSLDVQECFNLAQLPVQLQPVSVSESKSSSFAHLSPSPYVIFHVYRLFIPRLHTLFLLSLHLPQSWSVFWSQTKPLFHKSQANLHHYLLSLNSYCPYSLA